MAAGVPQIVIVMDDILKTTYKALCNYYNVLEKTGYTNFCKVRLLILLVYLEYVLREFSGFITNSDYTLIYNIMSCLMENNCLIPYERYKLYYKNSLNKVLGKLRQSTDSILRDTQDNKFRLK